MRTVPTRAAAIALLLTTACATDTDTPRRTTTTNAPRDPITVPARPGTSRLTIGDTTYTVTITECALGPGKRFNVGGDGTHNGKPIRLEYSNTTGTIDLFINPTHPLDPGDTQWTAPAPKPRLTATKLTTGTLTFRRISPDAERTGRLTTTCPARPTNTTQTATREG